MKTTGIYWFKHDLRLEDNSALNILCSKADELLCLFIIDPRWFKASHFQSSHMGDKRFTFLKQSLLNLDRELRLRGQKLVILEGEPLVVMGNIIRQIAPHAIGSSFHPGVYERQQWQRLKQYFDNIHFVQSDSHFLFSEEQLPFKLDLLPVSFTPFRKTVEELHPSPPVQVSQELPPPSTTNINNSIVFELTPCKGESAFKGGAEVGLAQLNHYLFVSHNVKYYKQTRNGLDGWDYSSKLSAWLANGSISVRQVFSELKRYEQANGENESTNWLYFELLWREFFQWYLVRHEHSLFRFSGVKDQRPLTTFIPQRFLRWCQGETAFPIVNACMKQLNSTGYMSNRGRQLVASCLIHELGIDWRFGAAYFEQQLIDFDVAANWGNWQYLAGVGADPRGHRHFDLTKQSVLYDPQEDFIKRWDGFSSKLPLDQTDAADWPIK